MRQKLLLRAGGLRFMGILLAMTGMGLAASAQLNTIYTRTPLSGLTYTQISGGNVINTNAGLSASMSNNQDDGAVLITLPFTFTYLDQPFTQVTMCTNGWIGFGNQLSVTAAQGRAGGNLWTATVPNNTIAAWFGDGGANFPTGNGSMVHGSIGTDTYAFEWRNAVSNGFTQNTNTNVINYMIVIYGPASGNPGRIELLYGPTIGSVSTGRTLGIENAVGGTNNYINALNGLSNSTATAGAWPGNGNGFQFNPPPQCSGAPIASTTNSTANPVCPNIPFTLSLGTVYPPFTGFSYQWQRNTGLGWTNISGAVSSTYASTGITANTDFRCAIVCNLNDTTFSTPVTISLSATPLVTVNPSSAISCASEAITLTASGADTYTWSPATNLSATTGDIVTSTATSNLTYTVTGTSTATGCTSKVAVNVTPIANYTFNTSVSPAQICAPGSPVTITPSAAGFISGGGQIEYQWLDATGTTILQNWSSSAYTFVPPSDDIYDFTVKARLSNCPATETALVPTSVTVGFGADVAVNNIFCGQTSGSILLTNSFGAIPSGIWYENNFSTAGLNSAQAQLYGTSANITGGRLILTPNTASQNGAIQIFNPNGINPATLNVDFRLTVGGGQSSTNGADGLSWSFGPDVVPIPTATNAENGSGTGLKIAFDAYGTGANGQAGLYLMYNCTVLDQSSTSPGVLQYVNNLSWKASTNNISISIDGAGRLTMKIGNNTIFNNVQLPPAYLAADKSTWRHVFVARTGGVSENHEIDDLKISYTQSLLAYGISTAGGGVPTSWQAGATFSNLALGSYDVYMADNANTSCNRLIGTYEIEDAQTPVPGNTLSNVASICANSNSPITLSLQNNYAAYSGITWQWQLFDGTNWTNIQGATNSTYTFTGLPQTTDYRALVSCDTNLTGESNLITLISVTPPTVSVTPDAVTLCTSEIASLTASGADTYVWGPATGLSATTGSNVQANPSSYQLYTITGTETATGCSNTATAYVTPIEFLPITTTTMPASICVAGTPVTIQVTSIPDYVAGFGTMEYQWLDSNNVVIQDWSLDSTYTFTPSNEGYHEYLVNVRSSACANVPSTKTVGFFVGFGGEVSTIDIDCYTPTGTISISDYFGQGSASPWYSNDFSSATLIATQATLHQNASITAGRAVLTPSATAQRGGFTILNPAGIPGTNVDYNISFNMTADTPINAFGTGGADGIAYSFGPDANYSNTTGNPCSGFGSKLRVVFDAAGNSNQNGNVTGIYVTYGYGGTDQVGPVQPTTLGFTGDVSTWKLKTDVPVNISITSDGILSLTVDNIVIFNNIQLPAEFQSLDKTTWKHVFSAQTGGDAMRQAIDNLNISYSALNFGLAPGNSATLPTTWQQATNFTGLTAGDYDVYVSKLDDELCNKFLGTYSIIDRNPVVNFPNDTILCPGQSFVLDAGNAGSFYEWNTGQVGTDEQFLTVTGQGTYLVEVTDTIGCQTSGIISVTAGVLPVVELGNDTSICDGAFIILDAGGDGASYLWNDNSQTQILTADANGTYSVVVTGSDGCATTDEITINVLAIPSLSGLGATVNGSSVAFVSQNPQNATTYAWNFGDGNTITTISPNINYNYANCGTYSVTVTLDNGNGCGTDFESTSVEIECVGFTDSEVNGGLYVYPNPATDFIAIANPNGINVERLSVYDVAGKQIFQSANAGNLIPDITSWTPGLYLVKLEAEGNTFIQRIIISK